MAIIRIPALVDPHVHMVSSEVNDWRYLAEVAKAAGYGALQIMPDLDPPITDKLAVSHFMRLSRQLPLALYFAAAGTAYNSEDLKQLRTISAVKVWLGSGPEDLVVTSEEQLRRILLSTDKVVMVHAEDEMTLLRNFDSGSQELSLSEHSQIFGREVAIRATVKAITAARETGRRVYLCHISTGEEVDLVRQAKAKKVRVYAEVAPHHLFLTEDDIDRLGTLGKVNPPLRTAADQRALWSAVADGTIDTIGSDTYAWWQAEKEVPYQEAPSGFPNLELTLPLLLTAVKEKRLSFAKAIQLTSINPARIFSVPRPTVSLFVDIDTPRILHPQLSDWQPYGQRKLVGWPVKVLESTRNSGVT